MANTKLVFLGTERSETEEFELQAFRNSYNEIYIDIRTPGEPFYQSYICLDRDTAIKLVKNLKYEISTMEVDR